MSKQNFHSSIVLTGCVILSLILPECSKTSVLPQKWRDDWISPSVAYRPLQIVHGADIRTKASYFKDSCGLGGVVCNVPFGEKYLRSEEEWKIWAEGVKAMNDSGLRVWIYDEDGYPSLAAGGKVLEKDPSLQAREMVYDKESRDPLIVRPCYEYTHSCNNFYVARKYPDPLNPKATQTFIGLTHKAYFNHLGPQLYGEVEAFFTEEPSMMAVNIGQLGESIRKNVRVVDPLDSGKKNLPMISWTEGLPQLYNARYGEEIMPAAGSLFRGASEADKVIRQKFWSMLADLDLKYFYAAIRDSCRAIRERNGGKGPLSSGHGLREENPYIHVPLDGNKLLASSGFDIPGLDQLDSDPSIWSSSSWMAAFFPNSAAMHSGQRRVMCEMSDFDQTLSGKGPVPLEKMEAATAWQMAFGVTDLTLYYTITYGDKYPYRREPAYKDYCDFVGRINSLLMEAEPVRKVLLYYPIYDLQREYIPTSEPISLETQSETTKVINTSFSELGSNLLKAQTQFVLADYLTLEKAIVNDNGTIQVGKNQYTSIVLPKGIVLPSNLPELFEQAKKKGVRVVNTGDYGTTPSPDQLSDLLGNTEKVPHSAASIAFGKFTRDGRKIYMLVNTGIDAYSGSIEGLRGESYVEADPQTGKFSEEKKLTGSKIDLSLNPLESRIYIIL